MEYYLENKIVLIEESNSWSLQEIDNEGKKIGCEQAPWPRGSFEFIAQNISYYYHLVVERGKLTTHEFMAGTLLPVGCSNQRNVKYSMFGTNRIIKNFVLRINLIEDEDERCHISGSPSHAYEIFFEHRTENDNIEISLDLSLQKFNCVHRLIKSQHDNNTICLSLSEVAGFYSPPSDIFLADTIKVLTARKEQEIIKGIESKIDAPRLGSIGKFNLHIKQ